MCHRLHPFCKLFRDVTTCNAMQYAYNIWALSCAWEYDAAVIYMPGDHICNETILETDRGCVALETRSGQAPCWGTDTQKCGLNKQCSVFPAI